MSFNSILENIKSLKIQGAENVAKSAVKAINFLVQKSNQKNPNHLYIDLKNAAYLLSKTRPTEPCMRNALKYILYMPNLSNINSFKQDVKNKIEFVNEFFINSDRLISDFGSKKIKRGSIIYTHCHSSSVINIFKKAKKTGVSFEVHNTETRPLLQGRITASELSKLSIKVKHYIDSAAHHALKDADLMLIGADAVTSEGNVINKIGSSLFAEVAHKYDVPVYICTNSWKFDADTFFGSDEIIEFRRESEVWIRKPKNVEIINPAFEQIQSEFITGIISELGIYNPVVFVQEVKREYPWMFESL
ncbi:MAG: hypothetical protein D6831_04170 [Aquificota bacterium]|nr:MAG: hypothetical protein D6831_04170 [Aquificota bacterium]